MAIGKSTVHWGVPITTPFFKRGCEKMPRLFLPGFFWDISLLRSHVSNKKKTPPVEAPSLSRFREDDSFHGQRRGGSLGSFGGWMGLVKVAGHVMFFLAFCIQK